MKHTKAIALAAAPLLVLALTGCGDDTSESTDDNRASASGTTADASTPEASEAAPEPASQVDVPEDATVLSCPTMGQIVLDISDNTAQVSAPQAPEPITDPNFTDVDPDDENEAYQDSQMAWYIIAYPDGTWHVSWWDELTDTCTQVAGPDRGRDKAEPARLVEFEVTDCDAFASLPTAPLELSFTVRDTTDQFDDITCTWSSDLVVQGPGDDFGAEAIEVRVADAPDYYLDEGATELTGLIETDNWSYAWQGSYVAVDGNGKALTCWVGFSDLYWDRNWARFGDAAAEFCDAALAIATGG